MVFLALFFSGCNEKQPDNIGNALNVVEINNPAHISIEDFITDIDTIRLETSDKCLISSISKMRIMDQRYYILTNNSSSIYVFNSDGSFNSEISDTGNGPGEYVRITSFEVDRTNKRIILSDAFSRRIFIYNTDGVQIEVLQLDFEPRLIIPHGNGFLNIYSGLRNQYGKKEMENYNVHFLDSKGKFISSAIKITTPKRIDIGTDFIIDCLNNGDVLFQPVLSNIVFKIEENEIIPFFEFHNSSRFKLLNQKEKNEFELIVGTKNSFEEKEKQGYLLTWGEVRDMDNYVFFSFGGYKTRHYLYYSKDLKETILIDNENIRGNKSLSEIFLSYPKAVSGDKIYISPDPFLIDEVKDKLPDGLVKTFFEKTNLDSNPVLLSFSIKFPEK